MGIMAFEFSEWLITHKIIIHNIITLQLRVTRCFGRPHYPAQNTNEKTALLLLCLGR